jgi:uncharacterized protein (DUF2267 family)
MSDWVEIEDRIGPDAERSWAALGAVLRALRDRLSVALIAHLSVRGAFYDQYRPAHQPSGERTAEAFLEGVTSALRGQQPVDVGKASQAVFDGLSHQAMCQGP